MTDEPQQPQPAEPQPEPAGRAQNPFERLFPGPAPLDPRLAARIDAVKRAAERRAEMQAQRGHRRGVGAVEPSPAGEAAPARPSLATTDDVEQLRDALHEQTDVMRALLDANTAIRDDARSTAQNSRTFAVAGTVIAFLTLVATAVTIVIAVH